MANPYTRELCRLAVGQICRTIGWHSIHERPLDILTHMLELYIQKLGRTAMKYAELCGRTEPVLADMEMAMRDMGVNLSDLKEYVQYVESEPLVYDVPKFPIERESHLNLLKPGSREVVTRLVHIHEHLPAMHPEMEEEEYRPKRSPLSVDTTVGSETGSPPHTSPKSNVFKRPGDPVSSESPSVRRARLMLEEEGRPLREISSVMMTTSGFLSPAREGKLPEARTPTQTSDSRSNSPTPSSYPAVPPEVKGDKKLKKAGSETSKKLDKEHKTKEGISELQTHDDEDDDANVKKLVSMKELSKLKALKSGALKITAPGSLSPILVTRKLPKAKLKPIASSLPTLSVIIPKLPKISQAKSPKDKSCSPGSKTLPEKTAVEGKLSCEPDKQKLNIFKKISKVKEDKPHDDLPVEELESSRRETRWAQIDEAIEAVIQRSKTPEIDIDMHLEGKKVDLFSNSEAVCDNLSSFENLGISKLPELPYKTDAKKMKRSRTKAESKTRTSPSPKRAKIDSMEMIENQKMPDSKQDQESVPACFPFFPHFPPAPGLIPPPIGHPLFSRFALPLGKHAPHPAMPNMPLPPPLFMQPRLPSPQPLTKEPETHSTSVASVVPSPGATATSLLTPAALPSIVPSLTPSVSLTPISSMALVKSDSPKDLLAILKEKPTDKKKEHKRDKKDKDKTKKKKDKKEKTKSKDRSEKKKDKTDRKERDKEKIKEKKEKKEKKREKEREEKEKAESAVGLPKIVFKLGPASPQPPVSDLPHRKIVIKPVLKKPEDGVDEKGSTDGRQEREASPELARITALITRPPKQKFLSKPHPPLAISVPSLASPSSPTNTNKKKIPQSPLSPKPKDPLKKLGRESEPLKESKAFYFDNDGNQVWICPACGGQDDGSPMIGCDGCDAWYHWVCVGIQVPPDSNDWFCRVCIGKTDELVGDKKKNKGKKKTRT